MNEQLNKLVWEHVPNQEKANELISRLFTVTRPSAVFSEPIVVGEHTVITASEITVAMGAGYGGGAGVDPSTGLAAEGTESESGVSDGSAGAGGGGGGGGTAMARPVAAISVGPNGVRVEPIVDPTKIALAFFTVVGSMVLSLAKMRRA